MSYNAKQIWKDVLASLGAIAMLVAGIMYIGEIKATAATNDQVHDTRLTHLEAAVGSLESKIEMLSADSTATKINSAVTNQLLKDLSTNRFQYDPRPAEQKVISRMASSTE